MQVEYFGTQVEVPDNTRCVATDTDGSVYAFTNDEPVFHPKTGTWCAYTNSFTLVDVNYDVDARHSLMSVPCLLDTMC